MSVPKTNLKLQKNPSQIPKKIEKKLIGSSYNFFCLFCKEMCNLIISKYISTEGPQLTQSLLAQFSQ